MASIFDWSSSASSNTSVDGININTGMSPSNVDNALRSIVGAVRSSFAAALQNFLAGTAALPVANGGTGGTDSASALAGLGALSSDYRDLPYRSASASFALADSDRGGGVEWTGGAGTCTLNPHATTAIGSTGKVAVIVVFNNGTGALTITRGSGVNLKKNGSTTSADIILAPGGQVTLCKFGVTDNWTGTGSNVS
jgi:hypothetical protein